MRSWPGSIAPRGLISRPSLILLVVLSAGIAAVANAQNAVTSRPANVRAGPDRSYPLVAHLDAGAPVMVNGCLDDWSWCDVSFGEDRGWVYAPAISYTYEGGYVPLYGYAPGLGIPVVTFEIGPYWDRYYHGRPWYAQRDVWVHRRPPPHMRPPGPAPHAGPPPHPEHAVHDERAHPDARASGPSERRAEPEHRQPSDAEHRPAKERGAVHGESERAQPGHNEPEHRQPEHREPEHHGPD